MDAWAISISRASRVRSVRICGSSRLPLTLERLHVDRRQRDRQNRGPLLRRRGQTVVARLRNQQMEGQPMIRVAAGPQPSSVSLSDGTADRQAHPQTIPLGREERIEELLEVIRRSADTGVPHGDEDARAAVLSLTTLAEDEQPARARRHL